MLQTIDERLESARRSIRALLLAQGYRSVRQLALAAGLQQPTLARFLDGTTAAMDIRHMMRLADCLGVSLSQLLGEDPMHDDMRVDQLLRLLRRLPEGGIDVVLATALAMLRGLP